MPIHEKSLIRPENIKTQDELIIEGIDVSGHWSTFIETRVVKDYNEELQEEIAALPGGENIHRCFQCGSCTNACTVNAIDPDFNPRYWIYLIRMGMEEELLRDKDRIWQCVSCNKCTNICPRDVAPEGVMKAVAHWMELKGHTEKSSSTVFDEVFSNQVFETGMIEESRTMRGFFGRTGQSLTQNWLVEMVKRLMRNLPIEMMMKLGLATLFRPKTKNWGPARDAMAEYVAEQHAIQAKALKLNEYATGESNIANQESN